MYHLVGNSFEASCRGGKPMFMASVLREEHSFVIMLVDVSEGKEPRHEPRLGNSSLDCLKWETLTGHNLAGEPSELEHQ